MLRSLLVSLLLSLPVIISAQIQGPQQVCINSVNSYSVDPIPGIEVYHWFTIHSNAEIINSDSTHANVKFTEPGTYTIYLEVIGEIGALDTLSYQVFVSYIYPAEVEITKGCYEYVQSTNKYLVCEGSTNELSIFSDPLPYMDSLIQIEGERLYVIQNDSYPQEITVTWGAAGNGIVSYVVLDQCYGFIFDFEILPKPKPKINTNKSLTNDTLEVCRGEQIEFSNIGVLGNSSNWDFGDGTTATAENVSHAFQTQGTYTVSLSSSQICDCTGSDQIVVKVKEDPAPQLDCINSVCPGTRQKYTATTEGNCNSYIWNVSQNGRIIRGGRSQDDFVEVIWESGPNGIIELSVSDCDQDHCSTVNTYRVPVISEEGPIEGDPNVCSGELVTYKAPYFPGTTYNWTVSGKGTIIGDADHASFTVLWDKVDKMHSDQWVRVTYSNCFLECGGEDQLDVIITPAISIGSESIVCQNSTPSVSAVAGFTSPNPVVVQWMIEDMDRNVVQMGPEAATYNPTLNFEAGEYQWVAINTSPANYCNDTIRTPFTIVAQPQKPTDIIGASEICPGLDYGYTTSTNNYQTQWTITDGSDTRTAQGATLSTSFGNNAPYQIKARYADLQYPQCVSDEDTLNINVVSGLEIEERSYACQDQRSTYEVRAIEGAEYNWKLSPPSAGEIKKDSKNMIEVMWAETGPAQITLEVCGQQITKNINVHPKPSFSIIGPDQLCANEIAEIRTDFSPATYTWRNENDIVISSNDVLQSGPGNYAVNVQDTFGCFASRSIEVERVGAPKVEVTADRGIFYCANPAPIRLVASSNEDNSFQWFRNDTALGETDRVIFIYQEGIYHVEASNALGCTAKSNVMNIIDCCPRDKCINEVICNNPNACPLLQEDLQVNISKPKCTIRAYEGMHPDLITDSSVIRLSTVDGQTIAEYEQNSVQHQFSAPGYYNIVFKGKLDGYSYANPSCKHSDIILDSIIAIAEFSHNTICAGNSMSFRDESMLMPGHEIVAYQWNFGDPASGPSNTSTEQDPEHIYASGGTYDVQLEITTSSGCVADITKTVTVQDGFDVDVRFPHPSCEETAVEFSLSKTLLDVQWDFGDPGSNNLNESGADDPLHTFNDPGTYNINIQGQNIAACMLDTTVSVEIMENTLAGNITVDPGTQICEGETIRLTAPNGGTAWLWNTEETTQSISTALGGQYDVFITDSFGCQYTPPAVFLDVLPKPRVQVKGRIYIDGEPQAWQDSLFLCEGQVVELAAFADDSLQYLWSTNETEKSIVFAPESGDGLDAGVHIISVTGQNEDCASDTAYFYIEVYENPEPLEILLSSGSACAMDQNTLEIKDPIADHTYIWSDGQTGTSINVNTSGNYSVTVTNENGCTNNSDNTIEILPVPDLDLIPGGCFTKCEPVEVCLPDLQNIGSYEIYRDGMLIDQGANLPSNYTADQDGSYEIVIESDNGCLSSSEILDLDLEPVAGSVFIRVWSDVNKNEIVDAGDTSLQAIAIQMIQDGLGVPPYKGSSDKNGHITFHDISGNNTLSLFNKALLPPQWEIVIDSVTAQIQSCGDTAIVDLLLVENCSVMGPDQEFVICPGEEVMVADSILSDTGSYVIHTAGNSGCDSIINVEISQPDSGTIHYSVWSDVDENGVISTADTLIPNTQLQIHASGSQKSVNTGALGASSTILSSGEYLFTIDQKHNQEYDILIDSLEANIPCAQDSLHFLLLKKCEAVQIDSSALICPGDTLRLGTQYITEEGTYTYVKSSGRCDTTINVQVWKYRAEYQLDFEECFGNSIEFYWTLFSDYSIQWSTGDTTDRIENLNAGQYSFTLQYGGGCVLEDSIRLKGANIEDISFQPLDPACPGEASGQIIKLNDSEDISWGVDSTQLTMMDTIKDLAAGEYSIFIHDEGCMTQMPFYIDLFDPVLGSLQLQDDVQLPQGVSIELTHNYMDSTDHNFNWSPASVLSCTNCIQPSFTGSTEDVWVQLKVTTPNGCVLQDSMLVKMEPSSNEIYVPNTFTPNGDGRNDIFNIYVPSTFEILQLRIFDRWGTLLYEELLPADATSFEGWDGTYQGKDVMPGVYVYQIEYIDPSGKRQTEEGTVFLHR